MKPNNTLSSLCFTSIILLLLFFFSSCGASKESAHSFLYFQNAGDSGTVLLPKDRIVRPFDLLDIQVTSQSLNQEQLLAFSSISSNAAIPARGVSVNSDGTIDLPVIGKINVNGLTKKQLEELLTLKIGVYVKEVTVKVRFVQFKIDILGEVKTPGVHNFDVEHVTVIDAISAAGDLTDNGKRNDIMVVREDATSRKFFRINITSADAFLSPGYQLQPDDIVYVGATAKKIESLNKSEHEGQKNWSFFLSIVSVATTTAFIIYSVTK